MGIGGTAHRDDYDIRCGYTVNRLGHRDQRKRCPRAAGSVATRTLASIAATAIFADMKHDPAPEELLPLPPATLHILLALAETERHGYAIMQDVEARTDGALRLSAGTLYRAIARMVEQGLIMEVGGKRRALADDARRRYYRITSLGTAVARAEVLRLLQLVRHARARGLTPGVA